MELQSAPRIAQLAADGRAQLLAHVDAEIVGLKSELETLQATRQALTGKHTVPSTPAPRARAGNGQRTTTRRRARPATRDVTEEAVMEAIRAGMGDQSPQLAQALHASSETILRRLRALQAKGMIRREGERAATRWLIAEAAAA